MKRLLVALALAAIAATAAAILWRLGGGPGQAGIAGDPADHGVTGGAPGEKRVGGTETVHTISLDAGGDEPPLPEGELTPEQEEKRARRAERDAAATEARHALFESNIASVDAAIEKAEIEGGNPEYIEALRQRRTLLAEQAAAEAAAWDGPAR